VQDLAGTSFALSGLARDIETTPEAGSGGRPLAHEIERLATAVRSSLLALRSLLVEIYPPQLDGAGLGAALQDLVAPVQEAAVTVHLEVGASEALSAQTTALVWRTAQECVRNAMRHANPRSLRISVTVGRDPAEAVLTVTDDGQGFDVARDPAPESFGLRGLRDLAQEAHGSLTVQSNTGEGTSVTLVVPAR
jgi:signal transduction histidine kinase